MSLNFSILSSPRSLILKWVAITFLALLIVFPQSLRADSSQKLKSAFLGDWHLQLEEEGKKKPVLLLINRLSNSKLQGEWVDSQRAQKHVEIKEQDKNIKLSIPTSGMAWECLLKLNNDSLSGKLNTDKKTYMVRGKKIPTVDTAEGRWAMFYTRDKITTSLLIKKGSQGQLTGNILRNGKTESLKSFNYSNRQVAFTWIQQDGTPYTYKGKLGSSSVLNGSLKIPGKEASFAMIRVGYEYMGTWDIQLRSKTLKFSQRLKINPDLSGWFGALPIRDVISTKDSVSFKVKVPYSIMADSPKAQGFMELQFEGKAKDGKLSGKLTNKKMKFNLSGKRR